MEPADVEKFRAMLAARRDELVREGDARIEPNRKDPGAIPDEDEQPLNEMNQVIASRRNKQRALELTRIRAALARLDEDPDEFGECQDCGEPIPLRRLEILPWAIYCVACQERNSEDSRGHRRRHALDFVD